MNKAAVPDLMAYVTVSKRVECSGGGNGGPADLKKTEGKVMSTCVIP